MWDGRCAMMGDYSILQCVCVADLEVKVSIVSCQRSGLRSGLGRETSSPAKGPLDFAVSGGFEQCGNVPWQKMVQSLISCFDGRTVFRFEVATFRLGKRDRVCL